MVFIKRKDKKLEDMIDEKAYETTIKYGESVEPLIYPLNLFKHPKSVFLQRVIQEGKECKLRS